MRKRPTEKNQTTRMQNTVEESDAAIDPTSNTANRFTADQLKSILGCERILGYSFIDKGILFEALTHSSFAEQRLRSNERMEFLGDSILGFVVCEYLYQNFTDWNEGDLTKVKSAVVSRDTCAKVGLELGIGEFISVGKGIGTLNRVPKSLLANAFEAMVAAIYLDGGLIAVREFLMPIVKHQVTHVIGSGFELNFKSELQHYVQKRFGVPPVYLVLGSSGPDHEKHFQIAAQVLKRIFEPAWGRNKKEAEQRAAANALATIAGKTPPFTGKV